MIHFLHGADIYRRQQRLRDLDKAYRHKYGLTLTSAIDLAEPGAVDQLDSFCNQRSMFETIKVGVIKNIFASKSSEEALALLKGALTNSNVILLISEFTDEKNSVPMDRVVIPKDFLFLLNKPAVAEEFDLYPAPKLAFYIVSEMKKHGIAVSLEAAELIVLVLKRNTPLIMQELEKIFLFHNNPNREITREDIEQHVEYLESPNIFGFTDAVGKHKTYAERFHYLEQLFMNDEEPAKIFNIFAKSPFIDIATVMMLADYDVAIKSGTLDYETAFVDMCLK